jgi:thiamine biosynthesis lipoprotein
MTALVYHAWRAMGCQMSVQLETDADGEALLSEAAARVEAFEARLTRFRPQSELMHLNAQAGQWTAVSDVLWEVVRLARHAARLTDGLFNPLVLPALIACGYDRTFEALDRPQAAQPQAAADWRDIGVRAAPRTICLPAGSAIDLGGIAKGWAAQQIANWLAPFGPCLVNFGGDLVARGAPDGLPGWEAAIEDPLSGEIVLRLWLRDHCLVTSGTGYRRWQSADGGVQHHIIDPRSGRAAATDVLSVSVRHPSAISAEAFAKAALLRGMHGGLAWLTRQWDAEGLAVGHDGAVLATPGFAAVSMEGALS